VELEEYLDLVLEDGIETTLTTIVEYLGRFLKCMFVSKTEGRERRNRGVGIPKRANWTIVLAFVVSLCHSSDREQDRTSH
jgi:hypothetical protein